MKQNEEKYIEDILVRNKGDDIPDEEVKEYVIRGRKRHANLYAMEVKIQGDEIDLSYFTKPVNFDRIRRITGYLVGSLDRFNNAKRTEVSDRVKHGLTENKN